jgi:hypothetical protein
VFSPLFAVEHVGTLTGSNNALFVVGDVPGSLGGPGRFLTVRERCKVMGFHPASICEHLTPAQVVRATGNAVPVALCGVVLHSVLSLVAEHHAHAVALTVPRPLPCPLLAGVPRAYEGSMPAAVEAIRALGWHTTTGYVNFEGFLATQLQCGDVVHARFRWHFALQELWVPSICKSGRAPILRCLFSHPAHCSCLAVCSRRPRSLP